MKPEVDQRQPPGGGGEEQQRHGRDDARPITVSGVQGADGAEREPAVDAVRPTTSCTAANGASHERLEREAADGVDPAADPLLDEAVEPEREGEDERDPREPAVPTAMHDDGDGADADATHCSVPQPLAQHEHAEQHRDDRVDEVAEGRLDHVAASVAMM